MGMKGVAPTMSNRAAWSGLNVKGGQATIPVLMWQLDLLLQEQVERTQAVKWSGHDQDGQLAGSLKLSIDT